MAPGPNAVKPARPPARTHALGPGMGKSGGGPSALTKPTRSRSQAHATSRSPRFSQVPLVASPPRKSHSEIFVRQTRGTALGTAPARSPWGFRHRGTSRRQTPTSAHARFRVGNGVRLMMGGEEEESARTGDSNPGCNYLVRGY